MREYLLVLCIAAAVTYLLSGVCRRLALRTGAMARVRDRDVHTIEMPYFGGVAMLAGVAAAILISWQLPFLGRLVTVQQDSRAVLVAATVICLVGVLDDVFELPPLTKFAGQVFAAGHRRCARRQDAVDTRCPTRSSRWIAPRRLRSRCSSSCSARTQSTSWTGWMGWPPEWSVLVRLPSSPIPTCSPSTEDLTRATTSSLITVTIAGACLGFLPHNFFPARMFMGDSGAMLLGLLLATSTISLTGQIDISQLQDGAGGLVPTVLPLVLPLAILALPFLDLTLAFIRRTYAGKWWFLPDKQHLHHRLLERGHSQRRAVMLMYVWSALVSFGVIILGLVQPERQWTVIAVGVVCALVLMVVTLGRPVRVKPQVRRGESLQ